MSAVHQAQGEAQALLARVDLQSLGSQVRVQPPAAGSGDDPAQKLAFNAARAKEVAASLPGLVEALQSARKHARHRQLILALAGIVIALILLRSVVSSGEERKTTNATQTIAASMTSTLTRLEERTGMAMVIVPAGDFTMGSWNREGYSDERPQRTVYLHDYWIDQTEVTVAHYHRCVESGACGLPSMGDPCNYYSGRSDHPVNCVPWSQAVAYCEWAEKRLPTEAEWEKAARGTDGLIYPWGNQPPDASLANFGGAIGGSTVPVASYPAGASPYGVLDMAGNVREWVLDWYKGTYYFLGPRKNPPGPTSGQGKVLRGGSWFDGPNEVRAAFRSRTTSINRTDTDGFRCVLSP